MINPRRISQGAFMEPKSHWDEVYSTKSSDAVSWYQPHATLSLEVIRGVARDKAACFSMSAAVPPAWWTTSWLKA